MTRYRSMLAIAKPLVSAAIARGWIKKATTKPVSIWTLYRRNLRARYHARGLTSNGKPRQRHQHPDLAGLPRKSYKAAYMRKLRNS